MSSFKQLAKDPFLVFSILVNKCIKGRAHFLSDRMYLSLLYLANFRKRINWKEPKTYNEKLQWLKVYDRNPMYSMLVDKCEVKKYVADLIGERYVIPTLGIWSRFDDIDFDILPKQFVIKCTHDSGGVVIVQDKTKLDKVSAKEKIEHNMKQVFYKKSREWPYKNVKPRIIVEQYIEGGTDGLRDYKFFCFNGRVYYMFIASDRNTPGEELKFDYYDRDFNRLPMRQKEHPNSTYDIKKPESYGEMIQIAEKLSQGIPQVRIDLYDIAGRVFFGEYTFFHHGGFVPFIPESYDYEWGKHIMLPNEK